MAALPRVIAYDLDSSSLESLREAFPADQVRAVSGATADSLDRDWSPESAALLVVGARQDLAQTLALCRSLRSQAGRARTPLVVLVQPAQEAQVRAALDASADSCLVLPVHAKEFVTMLRRTAAGNCPGRHTLGLHQPQRGDLWRDEGGEA
jgi:DNA-binding response OmpR family regulator